MTAFLFVSLGLCCAFLLALIAIMPWLWQKSSRENRLMAVNIDTFDARINELEEDKRAGLVDDDTYQAQIISLKRQLLAAKSPALRTRTVGVGSRLLVLAWIPILVVLAYYMVDNRTEVWQFWAKKDKLNEVADALLTAKIDTPPDWAAADSAALIAVMQANTHANAADPMRWLRLSELFTSLDAQSQALESLARAYRLNPSDDKVALTYAQLSFFMNDGAVDTQASRALDALLARAPNHESAMMLKVMIAAKNGDKQNARLWVQKLRTAIAQKPEDHSQSLAKLDEFISNLDKKTNAVLVRVDVGEYFSRDKVLFVTAVPQNGGAPYAVRRLSRDEFDALGGRVTLNDSHAMLPSRTLSSASEPVIINARVSKTGDAMPQSGDIVATPVPMADEVSLVANQVLP